MPSNSTMVRSGDHPTERGKHKEQSRLIGEHEVRNVPLRKMPEEEFITLGPHLEFIALPIALTLEGQGERIESGYFINSGMASIIVETSNGKSVEVGIAGREGMIGLELAAGFDEFTHEVVVQVPGDAFRIKAERLRQILPLLPELRRMLLRQLAMRTVELAQNAACNRLHGAPQRVARWLLLTHDRIASDRIATTHDFVARMVGTDRPTVSIVLREFERKGILRSGRASIVITSRPKLVQESCECYPLFKGFYVELGLQSSSKKSQQRMLAY